MTPLVILVAFAEMEHACAHALTTRRAREAPRAEEASACRPAQAPGVHLTTRARMVCVSKLCARCLIRVQAILIATPECVNPSVQDHPTALGETVDLGTVTPKTANALKFMIMVVGRLSRLCRKCRQLASTVIHSGCLKELSMIRTRALTCVRKAETVNWRSRARLQLGKTPARSGQEASICPQCRLLTLIPKPTIGITLDVFYFSLCSNFFFANFPIFYFFFNQVPTFQKTKKNAEM